MCHWLTGLRENTDTSFQAAATQLSLCRRCPLGKQVRAQWPPLRDYTSLHVNTKQRLNQNQMNQCITYQMYLTVVKINLPHFCCRLPLERFLASRRAAARDLWVLRQRDRSSSNKGAQAVYRGCHSLSTLGREEEDVSFLSALISTELSAQNAWHWHSLSCASHWI